MKKNVIIYGSAIGSFLGLFMLISLQFYSEGSDYALGEVIGYSSMIIAFCFMYFGIKSYRDKEAKGILSFGKGFAMGLLMVLIASVLYSLTWTIYTEVSDVNFMETFSEMKKNEMRSEGISEMEIDAEFASMEPMMEWYKNPILKFLITIVEPLPVGVIISLFLALMLKRKAVL